MDGCGSDVVLKSWTSFYHFVVIYSTLLCSQWLVNDHGSSNLGEFPNCV